MLVLVLVVVVVVMVVVVVVIVMWKSGGAHMILLVRIPKYKPTVMATGLTGMCMGMAPGMEKSICTCTCVPAGYIHTHVQYYSNHLLHLQQCATTTTISNDMSTTSTTSNSMLNTIATLSTTNLTHQNVLTISTAH